MSVLDPVEAHVPSSALVHEMLDVFADPASCWESHLRATSGDDWTEEPEAEVEGPVFRIS